MDGYNYDIIQQDFDFFAKVKAKVHNVDDLLHEFMAYLSEQFGAGVVSYRIPLFVGLEQKPLFLLRDCYIKDDLAGYYNKNDYFRDRFVRSKDQMGGYDKLINWNREDVIIDKAKNSDYYKCFADKVACFQEDTLIIPIMRGDSDLFGCGCPMTVMDVSTPFVNSNYSCFAKCFGVFKLRILRNPSDLSPDRQPKCFSNETLARLSVLAKHLSALLSSIMDRYENESLEAFRKTLKNTAFIKIKEFDELCSKVVKEAMHTHVCAIYRYVNGELLFSASSDPIDSEFYAVTEKYCEPTDGFVRSVFEKREPVYYVDDNVNWNHSLMIVPMVGKDNSQLGIMLLVGKENDSLGRCVSCTFWEHDKKQIRFIMDVLSRFKESDSERLSFMSLLSHELRNTIQGMMSLNDVDAVDSKLLTATEKTDLRSIIDNLVDKMKHNLNLCMMMNYTIGDVECVYASINGEIQCDFQMEDIREVIFNSIGLLGNENKHRITTSLNGMPNELYIDKFKMTEVVINLLTNAIKYSNNDERIAVTYKGFNENMGFYEISVEDYGLPVIADEKERIFDLRYRSVNARHVKGTGVGLYVVKQIMKAHGGDCVVDHLDFPTRFTIRIPKQK